MTTVDYLALWLVIAILFGVGHFLYFSDNFKKIYVGFTYVTHKGRSILVFPNAMIISAYLLCCVISVKILP